MLSEDRQQAYWRGVLRITRALLLLWFLISFIGPWFARDLEGVFIGPFPLSFWMASQGGLALFVAIIACYAWALDRLDSRYWEEDSAPDAQPGGERRP